MTTATKAKLLTAEDLLRMDAEGMRGELVRGVFHETTSSGINHGRAVVNFTIELGNFIKPRRLGTLVASDAGFLLERDPDTVREPDIAFISAERLPLGEDLPGYAEVVPDLVVEVSSPSDSPREIRERARMWLDFGAPLVWMAHPRTRGVDVYRADGAIFTLTENDMLDGGDVLPGFSCPVRDIFAA